MKQYFLFTFIALLLSLTSQCQDIVGKWKTIDDNTGKARSIVEIFEKDGKYFGKINELILEEGDDPDPVCDKCEDHRKGQKVIGMVFIENMKKDGDEYSGGKILDPEDGKIYRCKMWIEDGKLKVRGYLYFFYRTQTWHPHL